MLLHRILAIISIYIWWVYKHVDLTNLYRHMWPHRNLMLDQKHGWDGYICRAYQSVSFKVQAIVYNIVSIYSNRIVKYSIKAGRYVDVHDMSTCATVWNEDVLVKNMLSLTTLTAIRVSYSNIAFHRAGSHWRLLHTIRKAAYLENCITPVTPFTREVFIAKLMI